MSRETMLQLDGYPQLALMVRAIKYLGIYRKVALPKLGQAVIILARGV